MSVGAGEAVVRTKIGLLRGLLSLDIVNPRPGEKIYVSIRPECLQLDEFPAKENSFNGLIGNVTYFGEVAHYDFEKNGVCLRISAINPNHFADVKNRNMFAYASYRDVVILKS